MSRRARIIVAGVPAAVALLAVVTSGGAAGRVLPLGRFGGMTGDGHVFQFTVAPSASSVSPRKITHLYLVYDIDGCRSGPIRAVSFARVLFNAANRRGTFTGSIGLPGETVPHNKAQLKLVGHFTSATRATGTLQVGVAGLCPITSTTPILSFDAARTTAALSHAH